MMRKILLVGTLALGLAACDNSSLGEPPADNSPLAPEAVCDEPTQNDSDSALECAKFNNEVAEDIAAQNEAR